MMGGVPPYIYIGHRIEFWPTSVTLTLICWPSKYQGVQDHKCDLDIELWAIKIPRCTRPKVWPWHWIVGHQNTQVNKIAYSQVWPWHWFVGHQNTQVNKTKSVTLTLNCGASKYPGVQDHKCDLDIELWGIKIPRCTRSHADKYFVIQFYGSIFTCEWSNMRHKLWAKDIWTRQNLYAP